MLTKLLKYEWKATGRVILPIAGGVLVLNLVSSLLGHFVNNTGHTMPWVGFLTALLTLATFLGMLAVLAVCFFASIQRYYKLLGEQGYLMLSLPVHAWQHITAKLICGVLWTLFGFFYFGICGSFSLAILDGDGFSLSGINTNDIPLLLTFLLLILALIAMAQLHAYLACAFAGQFTQQRPLISIVSYFVLDFIGQLLFLLGVILFAVKVYPSLADISSFISTDSAILSSVCVVCLLVLLVDALLWALTQWLMTKQLTLA